MKDERGNIILTALFVAVFLFFLSIALIWTNRQDIALSLSMEHKMKAEVAARSGAMSVYSGLRSFDRPPNSLEGYLDSGASWRVELLELPEEGRRGKVLLLRCRGTSGPLSSYYTLHLLKNELSATVGAKDGRMLGFVSPQSPSGAGAGSAEEPKEGEASKAAEGGAGGPEAPKTPASQASAQVLMGDFELQTVKLGRDLAERGYAAFQGPLFATSEVAKPSIPLQVVAYLPVFDSLGMAAPKAYGPVAINAPPPRSEKSLSVMLYNGNEFSWEAIPDPVPQEQGLETPPIAALDLKGPGAWSTAATRAIGEMGNAYSWRDSLPGTSSIAEASDLSAGGEFMIDLNKTVEWGSVKKTATQRGYALRGTIAAYGKTVYSHAWEYLYQHSDGAAVTPPIPAIVGNTVTRWPCIRKYDLEAKEWSTAWSTLTDSGDVRSADLPDPEVLLVNSQGVCYSRTLEEPYRLLKLEPGGKVKVGDELASDTIFLYRDKPHVTVSEAEKPGLKNLETDAVIGFETLLDRIPEIAGPVVTEIENESKGSGLTELETSTLGADDGAPEARTVRHQYDLSYRVDAQSAVVSDGDDLYTNLVITMDKKPPTYELFGGFALKGASGSVLARYDGFRWHLLPNGLMAVLNGGPSSPGNHMFCARYDGLPAAKSRYTVVSIDTNPFEFSR